MSLTLTVDGERWRPHLRSVAEAHPGLVPVVKGNGYGLTLGRLARRSEWLGVDTIAVGTYPELSEVAQRFSGSLVVLTPWRPFVDELDPSLAPRVIHTLGRVADVEALLARDPRARFVLELRTSMVRHGFLARELWEAADRLRQHPGARLEGLALHLPLGQGSHLGEVRRLLNDAVAAGLEGLDTLWVSHLVGAELEWLRSAYGDFTIRPRIGTALWLGDRSALRVTSTVLDVHRVERGDVFGYRGRTAPRSGQLVVVSGGTAHGIGLESPTGESSLRARAATLARGGLDAAGFVRSPFSIDAKLRLFAEPPHMQASMLFVPGGTRVPEVGEQVEVRVRYTTTSFDRIVVT
ncbi:MAG: alanine racemase [Nocardioides sp.]|uniref:alanine racemase n=1 Tax=Nocardioides sp. TaxID=35761 RepID=UPI000C8FF838|nr:alanine racemase [Nocardioides sp.]MAS55876.1 alanine racemase [Pimelobacter sp.]MDE0778167.1 alanine racemase [Nocardioides sp.]